jgi:hypothetical protein
MRGYKVVMEAVINTPSPVYQNLARQDLGQAPPSIATLERITDPILVLFGIRDRTLRKALLFGIHSMEVLDHSCMSSWNKSDVGRSLACGT